ncbi:hypothetical protein PSTT_04566 [Puccinia striiformis]|uniref:J domain-containing protein n=1 Tax=Puccinia striiformis TaxID=27350 RepID=A0A2S4VS46_9BASI|nr:hypothetical protein PSTT_04566 [Puccinia striiformis]
MAVPNYYEVLSLQFDPTLTAEEIRTAYKKASLLTHPDRSPNLSEAERRLATENFQKVADAYYVLSNKNRRKEYDEILRTQQTQSNSTDGQSNNAFSDPIQFLKNFIFSNTSHANQGDQFRPNPEATFADLKICSNQKSKNWGNEDDKVEISRSSIRRNARIHSRKLTRISDWFISWKRLGAIRDAKGKSVCEVFSSLESNHKTLIIKALALKVLGYALT